MAQYVIAKDLPVKNPSGGQWPIKSAVAVDEGDPVGIDSNGQVVLADADAPVSAIGFAVFGDFGDGKATRTGVAALTVGCSIYKRATVVNIKGGTAMTIGADQFLSNTAATVATAASTASGAYAQCLGTALSATVFDGYAHPAALKVQATGNSTAAFR